jgi:uncharacterized protein YeeX (DUF496 family)
VTALATGVADLDREVRDLDREVRDLDRRLIRLETLAELFCVPPRLDDGRR